MIMSLNRPGKMKLPGNQSDDDHCMVARETGRFFEAPLHKSCKRQTEIDINLLLQSRGYVSSVSYQEPNKGCHLESILHEQ